MKKTFLYFAMLLSYEATYTQITSAEYFIDADPGVGKGVSINNITAGNTINFTATVSSASLTNGFHNLAIRTKDINGKWGLFEQAGFYVMPTPANAGNILTAEYFFDADPGPGNGIPLSITPGQIISQNFTIPVPAGITNGIHYLGIRFQDAWSLFHVDSFTVSGSLPLQWLSFTAQKNETKIDLNWTTTNEENLSRFEVERSSNGIVFNKLGVVNAFNTAGDHAYTFKDILPARGMNFYRLKQIDIDGKIAYSTVVNILFAQIEDAVIIYPNPAKNVLIISVATQSSKLFISLFDEKGVFIRSLLINAQGITQLSITSLAAGKYWIRISDGNMIKLKSFIKQ